MTKILSIASVFVLASLAQAGTVTELVLAPEYNPGGADADVYAVRVTADTDWTNARLIAEISEGSFIHVLEPGSFGAPDMAVPGLVLSRGNDALPDTAILGAITPGVLSELGRPTSNAPGFEETTTRWEAGFFGPPTDTDNVGTFDIGILSVTPGSSGVLTGTVFAGADAEQLNLAFGIPEPSTAILAGLALVGFVARRK